MEIYDISFDVKLASGDVRHVEDVGCNIVINDVEFGYWRLYQGYYATYKRDKDYIPETQMAKEVFNIKIKPHKGK